MRVWGEGICVVGIVTRRGERERSSKCVYRGASIGVEGCADCPWGKGYVVQVYCLKRE